jgi:hypothetical protein
MAAVRMTQPRLRPIVGEGGAMNLQGEGMRTYAEKIYSVLSPARIEEIRQHVVAKGYGAYWDDPAWQDWQWQAFTAQEFWDYRQRHLNPRLRRQAIEGVIRQLADAGEVVFK